jgi:hypothetical protein
VLIRSLIPFAVPVLLTIALLVIAGSSLPRDVAPGSGLKLAGLLATLLTTVLAWRVSVQGISDTRVRSVAGVLCLFVGLISWPVWSMGALPFVNALALQDERTVVMTLDRTESTPIRLSSDRNHWAWLTPTEAETGILPGRHFIPQATYDLWAAARPDSVTVQAATGLLGATVIIAIQ